MKATRKKAQPKTSTLSGSKNVSGVITDMYFSLATPPPVGFANQRHAMLYGFSLAGDDGYTDEQAAKAASLNLRSCFWKRASELRQFGYILPVKNDDGTWLTRKSDLGGTQQVWRMTKAGKKQLELWGWR